MKKETRINITAWAIVLVPLAAFIVAFFGAIYLMAAYGCSARWPDIHSEFRPVAGCLVEVNGKLIPEDRVRFGQEDSGK